MSYRQRASHFEAEQASVLRSASPFLLRNRDREIQAGVTIAGGEAHSIRHTHATFGRSFPMQRP